MQVTVDSAHFFLNGLAFNKNELGATLGRPGRKHEELNVAFILQAPPKDKIHKRDHLQRMADHDPASPRQIVVPHPRWFLDKMAKPAVGKPKCTSMTPPFCE